MKLIAFGALAVLCYAGSPPRNLQLAPITLYTQFQKPAPPPVLDALRDEVEGILAPGGFRFEWHDLSAAAAAGTAVELAVVTFRGACDVTSPLPHVSDTRTLGYTSISDGEILPFTTVDCDRTRGFLAHALLRLPIVDREPAFGRALGRILAHELYHIFANTQRHASSGVAKEAYSVSDLMGDDFQLEQREFELLHQGRAFTSLSVAGASSDTR
jgi:hypothetical protein